MRKRKVPDYGEFTGAGFPPIDAAALAGLERLLHEWDTAPDQARKQEAERALREALHNHHAASGFTATDGRRVEFRYRVHVRKGVTEERLAAFLTSVGQKAHGRAEVWAERLLADGRSTPEGFEDHFSVRWYMRVA